MKGAAVFSKISREIARKRGTKSVADSVIAEELGINEHELEKLRDKELTAADVVRLIARAKDAAIRAMALRAVKPLVEFFNIDRAKSPHGARWELFSIQHKVGGNHPYREGLRKSLKGARGIYVFYDSRGSAIYAGKTERQSLWAEMTSAYNRERTDQIVKRVRHPSSRVAYRGPGEVNRQIKRETVPLSEIAYYFSAYEVPERLVERFEALIVRAFANDLLNKRMENF